MKVVIWVFVHIGFIVFVIYSNWNEQKLFDMFMWIMPIIISLFFYTKENIYKFQQCISWLGNKFHPTLFTWNITIRFLFDEEDIPNVDQMISFVNQQSIFEVKKPSKSMDLQISEASAIESFKIWLKQDSQSLHFIIDFGKETLINIYDKLNRMNRFLKIIKDEYYPSNIQYEFNWSSDSYYINMNLWRLLSEKYKTKLSIFSTTDNIQRRCEISVTKNIPTNELNYTQNFFQNEQLYILMHDDYEKFAESLNSYINLSLKNL